MRTLVLLSRDLRVHDHPALADAARRGEVVPLFVLDPDALAPSPNRARFLLASLADLDRSLRERGGRLIVRRGSPAPTAIEVARSTGCDRLVVTGDVSAYARRREEHLEGACRDAGIAFEVFAGNAVVEPGDVAPASSDGYRVFTPYFRAWSAATRRPVVAAPERIATPDGIDSDDLPDPSSVEIDAGSLPDGGETAGRARMDAYLRSGVSRYEEGRDDLAADVTSHLSAYLRFGCVSANELAARASGVAGAEPFVRQLCWRDFFLQLLASDPALAWRDLRPAPEMQAPLIDAAEALERWRAGTTGLPLVDAGMRQLAAEGFMHNRARMVTASFLTRRLVLPWQDGAAHFFRLLVDGDPANNSGGWQWVAGTGTDPRRMRSFNPVRQAKRFDPEGTYVRRYVPELADVPTPALFAPWLDADLLRRTGYPAPLLEVPVNS